ncbi:MAG: hypothetical protein K2J65_02070 [Duncaniella sp.]|nr:hypothetical protein [Duncaniella sp.]
MSNDRFKSAETERLRPESNVRVEITNINGDIVAGYTGSGFTKISDAIDKAYDAYSDLLASKEDYVYTVTDTSDSITHRYRINAGGHARLVV